MSDSFLRCAYVVKIPATSEFEMAQFIRDHIRLSHDRVFDLSDEYDREDYLDGLWDTPWGYYQSKGSYYLYVDVLEKDYGVTWSKSVSEMKSEAQEIADFFGVPVRDVIFSVAHHYNGCEWDVMAHEPGDVASVTDLLNTYRVEHV
tara:strand:+ start:18394 stop:18831 length:438 start_codon:yes stop_codon:yes gene_type:complete